MNVRLVNGYNKIKTSGYTAYSYKLPKNMVLRRCTPHSKSNSNLNKSETFPLIIILGWVMAKETHLEKYRQLWFRRGFDVLTIQTSLFDFLLPPIGAQQVANKLINYLLKSGQHSYNQIVFHVFSAGAYQMGEILVKLRSNPSQYSNIRNLVKGIIIDSMVHSVDVKQTAYVVSKGINRNVLIQPILQIFFELYFYFTQKITLNNYRNATNQINTNHFSIPGLIFYSSNDDISDPKLNEKLLADWIRLGIVAQIKCWQQSKHVLHYRFHSQEYEQELDVFIAKIKIDFN